MPLKNVELPDSLRYKILHLLIKDDKIPDIIEMEIRPRPGRPKYIVPYGDLPEGTVSEIVYYRLKVNGWKLVKAHQYRLPDGSIQGGPDPKYIVIDDAVFVPIPKAPA